MLRMSVEGVGMDRLRQTVVVLKDWDGKKILPIWIGPNEARAIALEMEGARPPRPLSHDLLLECIQLRGGRLTRVVINDLQESTFFATLDIDTPRGLAHIDSRPSDALALAVRAKCPIFVDGGALDALVDVSETEAQVEPMDDEPARELPAPEESDEEARFRRLMEGD